MILAARGNQEAVVQQAVAIRMADRGRINPDTGMSDADYYADDLATKLPDDKRQTFYEALSGKSTPLTVLLDDYLKGYQVEAKTKAMAKSSQPKKLLCLVFKTLFKLKAQWQASIAAKVLW